jgi:acylphosphatase
MHREAQNLEVSGWVRNRADGTVEAVIQGDAGAVDALLRWAERGPEMAQVERVEKELAEGNFTHFEIT